ncbi:MAG: cupredoxin domain-containing protein [Candidatus Omnitrophica bacterium]|nr:cupredoxin domain-containing protein [Candidatus Omnitrophota bacterium]MCM8810989.1 cupredoxin domain-containing protein [Candidatus Omnitrophota bacterium]
MKKIYFGLIIVGLIVLVLTLYDCSKKKHMEESVFGSKPESAITESQANFSGKIVNGFREIEIEAFQFGFKPEKIVVKKDEKIRLIAKSIDVLHGIAIKEYNINQELPPNKIKIIEFTADKAGEFHFYCSVFCGAGHGKMHGKLIVKE